MNTGDKYIFAADTPNGYQEIKRINNIIESCRPPYIDAETLRIKAEETWPQWKIDSYNDYIATTAHARKLCKQDMDNIVEEVKESLIKEEEDAKSHLLTFYEEFINSQIGDPYPCSNQIVGCYMFVKERKSPKIDKYIEEHNGTRLNKDKFQLPNGEVYTIVSVSDSARGKRAYKAIVDRDIDYNLLQNIILPICNHYCCKFEVF